MRAAATSQGRSAVRPGPSVGGYVVLVAAAWLALGAIQGSEHAWFFRHEVLGARGFAPPLAVTGYISGWSLMLVAMMVPNVLPALARARGVRRAENGAKHGRERAAWLAGYLAPWLLFGFAFGAADLLVHVLIAPLQPQLVTRAPAIFWLAAGAQLLVRVVAAHALPQHLPGTTMTFVGGWFDGWVCLRRDWLLMLAVVGSGHDNLLVMAAATVVMSGPAIASVMRSRQPAQ